METLKRRGMLISEFDEELWYITVESMKVYDGGRIVFAFKNGSAVEIPAIK